MKILTYKEMTKEDLIELMNMLIDSCYENRNEVNTVWTKQLYEIKEELKTRK